MYVEKLIWWPFRELCVELDTYPSGLSELRYPHSFPSPPRLSQSPQPMPSTVGSGIATGGGEGAYPLSSVLNASSPTTMEQQSIPLSGTRTNHLRLHYHTGSTTANREEDEITWFYYLAEIALRKIESTIIESRALNKWKRNIQGHTGENEEDDEDGSQQEMGSRGVSSIYVQAPPSRPPRTPTQAEMEEFIFHTKMFESQLETWTQCLPAQVKFADLDPAPCTDERLQYLRGRLWKTKSDLYRPFTYHLIHHVHSPLHNQNVYNKVAAFAKKGLTYDMLFIKANVTEHRHHGAWLSLRGIGCGALVYLAARKSGHFKGLIPEGWDEAMEKAKVTLKYWGGQMGTKDSKLTYELICKVEEDWFGTRLRGGIMGFGDGGY